MICCRSGVPSNFDYDYEYDYEEEELGGAIRVRAIRKEIRDR